MRPRACRSLPPAALHNPLVLEFMCVPGDQADLAEDLDSDSGAAEDSDDEGGASSESGEEGESAEVVSEETEGAGAEEEDEGDDGPYWCCGACRAKRTGAKRRRRHADWWQAPVADAGSDAFQDQVAEWREQLGRLQLAVLRCDVRFAQRLRGFLHTMEPNEREALLRGPLVCWDMADVETADEDEAADILSEALRYLLNSSPAVQRHVTQLELSVPPEERGEVRNADQGIPARHVSGDSWCCRAAGLRAEWSSPCLHLDVVHGPAACYARRPPHCSDMLVGWWPFALPSVTPHLITATWRHEC